SGNWSRAARREFLAKAGNPFHESFLTSWMTCRCPPDWRLAALELHWRRNRCVRLRPQSGESTLGLACRKRPPSLVLGRTSSPPSHGSARPHQGRVQPRPLAEPSRARLLRANTQAEGITRGRVNLSLC